MHNPPPIPQQVSSFPNPTPPAITSFSFALAPHTIHGTIDLDEEYTSPIPFCNEEQEGEEEQAEDAQPAQQGVPTPHDAYAASETLGISLKGLTTEPMSRWEEFLRRVYRSASKAAHPDCGGSAAAFQKLSRAPALWRGGSLTRASHGRSFSETRWCVSACSA